MVKKEQISGFDIYETHEWECKYSPINTGDRVILPEWMKREYKRGDEMTVVIKEPQKDPYVKVIHNDLRGIQDVVGGFFEVVRYIDGIVMVCNDEGKVWGMPYNFTYRNDDIVGPVFFCGEKLGPDGGEFCSLSAEQLRTVMEAFA